MEYLVRLTARAERDFAALYDAINAGQSAAARQWYRGLREVILTLEDDPNRCPMTPESRLHRHLLYGSKPHVYRVIYRVDEASRCVYVIHLRHGARGSIRI